MKGSVPLVIKILGIHCFLGIIAFGIKYYHQSGPDLVWNMILAVIALDFAVVAFYSRYKLTRIIFVLLWLFFYPNTFYMLTDIVHMHFVGTVLYKQESMILYMLYVPSILFGTLCGLESVRIVVMSLSLSSVWIRLVLYTILSFISSFAIHIGRYARLNSWDLFTRPMKVFHEIVAVVSWDAIYFIAGFTCIQLMCLYFTDSFKSLDR
ncbi:DUF1361 domain-containing protein [Streptococcus saliviloxodontae]|uniref:Membrane protein n=1 Tax=Streptococcus saliviloxodontae TaxID=1349416 RepID=A0ABS2PMH3_9STRE|nr:DUF1361 domain-containing protein [Streptococcus saliviloxodontae]MBM7636477.1 putative membrane protein [Streptococcus saliviloxodontae]